MAVQANTQQLRMAYSVCRGVARGQAKNFYYAFLALPQRKRNALCAVYAFMRHADDLSDDPGLEPRDRDLKLREWAEALHIAVNGTPTDDPVILALADTVIRFRIPLEYFDQLVSGTMMDIQFAAHDPDGSTLAPYQTFDELYTYCYHVASVVGLVCLYIFEFEDDRAKQYAEQLGIAFQLTNIIRDVKEDALNGRIYLPVDDIARFGRSPDELAAAHVNNGFNASAFTPLLEFEAQRARGFYQAVRELLPLIHADSRACLWTLAEIYQRLLNKIALANYNVFGEKIRLTTTEKLKVLGQGLLRAAHLNG